MVESSLPYQLYVGILRDQQRFAWDVKAKAIRVYWQHPITEPMWWWGNILFSGLERFFLERI